MALRWLHPLLQMSAQCLQARRHRNHLQLRQALQLGQVLQLVLQTVLLVHCQARQHRLQFRWQR